MSNEKNKLEKITEQFLSEVADISDENAVSFELFFSYAGGHVIKFTYRTPQELKESNISMRNLKGKWIQGGPG